MQRKRFSVIGEPTPVVKSYPGPASNPMTITGLPMLLNCPDEFVPLVMSWNDPDFAL